MENDAKPANYDKLLEDYSYKNAEERIKQLSRDSGLRFINALQYSRKIKEQLQGMQNKDGLTFDEFKALLEPELKKVARAVIEKKGFEKNLKEIFYIFDDNSKLIWLICFIENGLVDQREISNCLALMCGGSFVDKI